MLADELLMSADLVYASTGVVPPLHLTALCTSFPRGTDGVQRLAPARSDEAPSGKGHLWPKAGDLVELAENWVASPASAARASDAGERLSTGQNSVHLTAGLEGSVSAGHDGTGDGLPSLGGGAEVSRGAAAGRFEVSLATAGPSQRCGGHRSATSRGQVAEILPVGRRHPAGGLPRAPLAAVVATFSSREPQPHPGAENFVLTWTEITGRATNGVSALRTTTASASVPTTAPRRSRGRGSRRV